MNKATQDTGKPLDLGKLFLECIFVEIDMKIDSNEIDIE